MILIDHSHLSVFLITGGCIEVAKGDDGVLLMREYRHLFLNHILNLKQKFSAYGNLVFATDSKKDAYWRKKYFPNYKYQRTNIKKESPFNWELIDACKQKMILDLREFFPYYTIDVPGAEADDIIACLVKYTQDNELIEEGLLGGHPQSVMISSDDTDFFQLQKYENVQQYSPREKKLIKPKVTLKEFITEHIVRGDSGDGIMNILMGDNTFVEKIRQKPITKDILNNFEKNGFDACENDTIKRNYIRNQTLVDFEYIPKEINDAILKEYILQKPVKNIGKIQNYLLRKGLVEFLAESHKF